MRVSAPLVVLEFPPILSVYFDYRMTIVIASPQGGRGNPALGTEVVWMATPFGLAMTKWAL